MCKAMQVPKERDASISAGGRAGSLLIKAGAVVPCRQSAASVPQAALQCSLLASGTDATCLLGVQVWDKYANMSAHNNCTLQLSMWQVETSQMVMSRHARHSVLMKVSSATSPGRLEQMDMSSMNVHYWGDPGKGVDAPH